MIVKSDKSGCLGIPLESADKAVTECISLVPGYNEIPDTIWVRCRKNALGLIELGILTEQWVKIDAEDAKGYLESLVLPSDIGTETKKRLVPAKFADVDRKGQKVSKIVLGTFDVPTLQTWLDTDLRQDVRLELMKQIDGINKGTIKG